MSITINPVTLRQDSSPGTMGGSAFATTVARSLPGKEQRLVRWLTPSSMWKLAWQTERDAALLASLIDFYNGAKGQANGFWFAPPFSAVAVNETPTPLGSNQYQLVRRSMSESVMVGRNIRWVIGNVAVRQGTSTIAPADYSVNASTGVLTYAGYKPLDVIWVVDKTCGTSQTPYGGSILSTILTAVERINTRINALSASNKMGLVTYDTAGTDVQDLTTNLATINAAVAGVTNSAVSPSIAAGITAARTAMEAHGTAGHVQTVILTGTGASSSDPTSTVQSMMTAHPDWSFVTLCVNDLFGSRGATASAEEALMASLGALGIGSYLSATTASTVNVGQKTLGLLFGVSVGTTQPYSAGFGIPMRFTSDMMKAQQNGLEFGWADVTLSEVRQEFSGFLALQDSSMFDPVEMPQRYTAGSEAGPTYRTKVTTVQSGFEDTVSYQASPLVVGKVPVVNISRSTLEDFNDFFNCRLGRARPFLFQDLKDYQVVGQLIGVGTGSLHTFQLVEVYPDSGLTRVITKPQPGTVQISVASVALVEWVDFTVNYLTGVVTIVSAPAMSASVDATFDFYIPARWDADNFDGKINFQVGSWSMGIAEVQA